MRCLSHIIFAALFQYLTIGLMACGNEPPPALPSAEQNSDLIVGGSGRTVSAEQEITDSNSGNSSNNVTNFRSVNVGAEVGSSEEQESVKKCLSENSRYDRNAKKCDSTHSPVMSFAWTIDGIVQGLNLKGNSETNLRSFFQKGGQFEGWLIDQITKGPDGKTWIFVVKDSGSFLITNHLAIGG